MIGRSITKLPPKLGAETTNSGVFTANSSEKKSGYKKIHGRNVLFLSSHIEGLLLCFVMNYTKIKHLGFGQTAG